LDKNTRNEALWGGGPKEEGELRKGTEYSSYPRMTFLKITPLPSV